MSIPRGCPSVVARHAERASLEAALDGLADRVGAVHCLLGEAGIGKSRLAAEVATLAGARAIPVLVGRAVDGATPAPFRPLFEALSGYFRVSGEDAHPELTHLRATLSPIVPEWRPEQEQPFRSTVELAEALLRLLTGIGGDRGCVVVLEDLQWADPETTAILEYVGDNIAAAGVLCLVTLRTDTASPAIRIVRALASRRAATVHELQRLHPDDLAEMTQLCLAAESVPADVDLLVQRFSDGLPFLVEELLTSAIASGSLVGGPDGWRFEEDRGPVLPWGFEELVRRRLARLSDEEADTMSVAAFLGPRFDAELLLTVSGRSTEELLGALRKGVEAHLLVADADDPRKFAFRHALTRDGLLSQMLPFERVAHARRVLAALEEHHPDLPGDLCELAAGLAEQAGEGERAAELLLLAARRAADRGAFSSAEPTLDRAWQLAQRKDAVWLAIGETLIDVLTERGDVDRALEVGGQLLADLPASGDRSGINLAMARAAATAERWDQAVQRLDQARASADPADATLQGAADSLAAEIAVGEHRYHEAEALASRALAEVEQYGGSHTVSCQALLVLGRCARRRGGDGAAESFDRVIEIAREQGLPAWELRAMMERASLDLWGFQPPVEIEAARDRAAESGALVMAAHLDNFRAWSALDHRDPAQAEAAVTRCLDLTRKMRLTILEGIALGAAAVAAAQRGDRPMMEQRIVEAVSVSGGHSDVAVIAAVARARYWTRRDDLRRMAAELDAAMELLRRAPHFPLPDRGLWALVRVYEDRGGGEALAELGDDPALNHVMSKAYWHYATAIALGRAGEGRAAESHVALADAATTPLAWFQHHARRLVAEAALVDGWGRPREWLREALAEFELRGDDELAASCRGLLARAGSPVRRRAVAAGGVPDDLRARGITARELQVLELLAEATATRDIADRLFVSPKTVERHVANMVAKLEVVGRAGLVAFAAARFPAAPLTATAPDRSTARNGG